MMLIKAIWVILALRAIVHWIVTSISPDRAKEKGEDIEMKVSHFTNDQFNLFMWLVFLLLLGMFSFTVFGFLKFGILNISGNLSEKVFFIVLGIPFVYRNFIELKKAMAFINKGV